MTFLDSDDEYLPTKLQQQVDALAARSDVKAIECALRVVTDGHEEVIGPFLAGMSFEDFLGFEHGINIGTLLLRRDLAAAVGFDEAIKVDDWDFVLRMLAHAQVAAIDRPLLVVHNLPGPRLSTAANIMAGWQQVIRKHEGAIRNKPRLLARWYHRMAFFYIGFGDLAAARRELLRAVRLWPWNLARWLLLLATLMGGDVFTFILGAYRRAGRFKKRLGRRPRTSWAEGV